MGWARDEGGASSLPGIRFFGRKKIRIRVMAWWEKVACPVKRAWIFVAARVKAGRNSGINQITSYSCGIAFRRCRIQLGQVAREASLHGRRNPTTGPGIMRLHDDVQTCGYQDVQVMWEMLRTEMELSAHTAKRRRPLWRVLVWSDGRAAGAERQQQHHHH